MGSNSVEDLLVSCLQQLKLRGRCCEMPSFSDISAVYDFISVIFHLIQKFLHRFIVHNKYLIVFFWSIFRVSYRLIVKISFYSVYLIFFYFRDSLVRPRPSKHFTAAPNSGTASNKPNWESSYFSESSDNAAWTRSEPERKKNGTKIANWPWSRRESTSSDRRCGNSWRC